MHDRTLVVLHEGLCSRVSRHYTLGHLGPCMLYIAFNRSENIHIACLRAVSCVSNVASICGLSIIKYHLRFSLNFIATVLYIFNTTGIYYIACPVALIYIALKHFISNYSRQTKYNSTTVHKRNKTKEKKRHPKHKTNNQEKGIKHYPYS
jgi:hypothetical protein